MRVPTREMAGDTQTRKTLHRSNSRLRETTLLVASVLVALGLFELTVRIIGVDYNPSAHWHYNAALGWTQPPGGSFTEKFVNQTVHLTFNRLGFRDIDHTVAKPPGTQRLLVLGDSFSEAAQVSLEQTFFKILEARAKNETGVSWEAINLGVGDFGTAQELLALEEYGLQYDPDLVIVQVFPLNDICNNTIELFSLCKSQNDRYRPYFVADERGLRLTYAHPWRALLRKHSVTFGLLEKLVLTVSNADSWVSDETLRMQEMSLRGYPPADPLVNTLQPNENQMAPVKQGWHITEGILARMAARCAELGIPLAAVVIPFEERVSTNVGAHLHYPEQRLERLFEQLGVPAVFMKEHFDRNAHLVLPYWEGHLNPEGHRLTANAIYDKLSAVARSGPQN